VQNPAGYPSVQTRPTIEPVTTNTSIWLEQASVEKGSHIEAYPLFQFQGILAIILDRASSGFTRIGVFLCACVQPKRIVWWGPWQFQEGIKEGAKVEIGKVLQITLHTMYTKNKKVGTKLTKDTICESKTNCSIFFWWCQQQSKNDHPRTEPTVHRIKKDHRAREDGSNLIPTGASIAHRHAYFSHGKSSSPSSLITLIKNAWPCNLQKKILKILRNNIAHCAWNQYNCIWKLYKMYLESYLHFWKLYSVIYSQDATRIDSPDNLHSHLINH